MPGIDYQDADYFRKYLSPEQNAGIDTARKADQVRKANEETVRQRYLDPKLMSKITWDQLVTAGKAGTLSQLGFPDLHFNDQTGKFDTPSMFNDHAITLNPDGKGGIKPYAEPASNGWIADHKHELWAAAAVIATVLTAGYAGGLLGAAEVGGEAVAGTALGTMTTAEVAAGGSALAGSATAGAAEALGGLAGTAVAGGGVVGGGALAGTVAGAGTGLATGMATGGLEALGGLAPTAIEGGAGAVAGAVAGGTAGSSIGTGLLADGTIDGGIQLAGTTGTHLTGTGLTALTPAQIAGGAAGAGALATSNLGGSPEAAEPSKLDQAKKIYKGGKMVNNVLGGKTKEVDAGDGLLGAGLLAGGAAALSKDGAGTTSDPTGLIKKQTSVGDELDTRLNKLYPQVDTDLKDANNTADHAFDTYGGLATGSVKRGDDMQGNYDHVINPLLTKNLNQGQAYTDNALKQNADTMSDLRGNANDLQSQWKNFMYPAGKQVVQQGADFTTNALNLTGKTANDAGQHMQDAYGDWQGTNAAFKSQLKDSKVTSDAATKKFNDFAAQNGDMISNLRDRMGMSEPLIKQIIQQAMEYNTAGNTERQAGLALGDTHTQYDAQRNAELQKMQSYGIDPTSGRYAGADTASRNSEAATGAAAATRARDAAVALGWQKQLDAVSASNSSNAAYQTYNQLANTQTGNVQAGLNAQNSNIDNLAKYTNAGNTAADTQGKYANIQNNAITTGENANTSQMGNVSKLLDMSKTYNDSFNSVTNTMNNTSAAGQGLTKGQLDNINSASTTTNNFNNAANTNATTSAGLVTDQVKVKDNKLTNDSNAATIYGTGAKNVASIYGTAGQQAVGLHTANKVADAANAAGYGKLAGTVLDKYGGTIANGVGALLDGAGSGAGSGLVDDFIGSDWL